MIRDTAVPNKPGRKNAAIALRLHSGHLWRGVCDPDRSAALPHRRESQYEHHRGTNFASQQIIADDSRRLGCLSVRRICHLLSRRHLLRRHVNKEGPFLGVLGTDRRAEGFW